ncbi:hypothetical protein [Streptomyces yanii]|uniref:Tn3 transposase DDE domain-containing protein n=1 Tax=Streptomyces yanii TaxID=78510 RepID=A0ABV5R3R7_9ACTN
MLLRLVHFGVTNAFALLRLLSTSDRDRIVETLALRHQITDWSANWVQSGCGSRRPTERSSPCC